MNDIFIIMTGNIYTLAIIAVPIYFFFYLVKKIIKIIPHPGIPTAVIMIPLFIFGASYDRVLFDKKIKNTQDNLSFLKTYNVTYWGAIHEPMTWFNKYIGFIRLTAPRDPMMAGNYHTNLYFRQDQEPMKDSLFGDTTMYGPEGLRFYTRPKVVTSRWPDPATSTVNLGFPQND